MDIYYSIKFDIFYRNGIYYSLLYELLLPLVSKSDREVCAAKLSVCNS